jgi:hypothetical protein
MMLTLVEQLNAAFVRSKLSVAELLSRTELDLDRSSLHRKLRGELRMNTEEAERIATVLGVTIAFAPERPA